MRIATFAADDGACGRYRIKWAARVLADQGHDITIGTPAIRTTFSDRFDGIGAVPPPPWIRVLDSTIDAGVVVIQRPTHRQWLDIVPMLQEKGVRVVVDIDDDFDRIDRGNVTWYEHEPHWLPADELAQWQRIGEVRVTKTARLAEDNASERTCHYCPDIEGSSNRAILRAVVGLADHVVVSTPALAAHYGRFARAVTVVRNHIPAGYLAIGRQKRTSTPLRVGWTGTVRVHPKDLQTVGHGLSRVAAPHRFCVIGDGAGVEAAIGRRIDAASGWMPLSDYPYAYSALDVAVCPLTNSAFNRSKSALKMLEASALGVVPIASPSPEYLWLHEQGVGLIARNAYEWRSHVERLLTDPLELHRLRMQGLEVASTLTIESHADEWLRAWTGANDRARVAA